MSGPEPEEDEEEEGSTRVAQDLAQLKQQLMRESLVFEYLGDPPLKRRFVFKDLRRWGFDLFAGRRGGTPGYYLADQEDKRRTGERFTREGEEYEIDEILDALPPKARLLGRIRMEEGHALLDLSLAEKGTADEDAPVIASLPAAALLLGYLRKRRCHRLFAALANCGRLSEMTQGSGQMGRAQSYAALPARFRHFVKEARKIGQEAGAGRISLAYFGENKERRPRYRLSWLLPTLALFDTDLAERIDRMLDALES